jgi:hypothetical protein
MNSYEPCQRLWFVKIPADWYLTLLACLWRIANSRTNPLQAT